MSDAPQRQPAPRQPGPQVPTGRNPRARPDGPAAGPGWDRSAPTVPRYNPAGPAPYYPPGQRAAPTQAQPGLRPGPPRGPLPSGAPGRPLRPPDPTQALGLTRSRVPAGPQVAPGTRPVYGPPDPPELAPVEGRRKVVRDVHDRRVIRRVDVWSVFKVSFIFYVCVLAVLLIAGTVLWNVARASGVINQIEKLVRSLFALTSFQLHPLTVLAWAAAILGAVCLIGILFNVLATVLYNLISDVIGGIQVIVVDDQDG